MYKKLFLSNTFILTLLISVISVGLWMHLDTGAIFGVNNLAGWERVFFFSPKEPLYGFGTSILLSFFYHSTLEHLLLNGALFYFISFLCESKLTRIKHLLAVAVIHSASLALLSFNYSFNGLDKQIFLSGSSATTFGLLAFYFVLQKKWLTFGFAFGVLLLNQLGVFELFKLSGSIIDPHLVGFMVGGAIKGARSYFFLRRDKK